MDRKKRLYFAHPINVYGTPLQAELLGHLAAAFPDCEIVNPDAPEHQQGYEEYARAHPDGSGMGYFFEKVLPTCDAVVMLAFRDGKIGAGVFGEAEWFQARACSKWEIFPDGTMTWVDRLDPARKLDRDATRARIRNPDRSTKPY